MRKRLFGRVRDRAAGVALASFAAFASVALIAGAGIGAAYDGAHASATSPCQLKTSFPQPPAGDSSQEAPVSDGPPATTCVKTELGLFSSSGSPVTPKGGLSARLRVSVTIDSACATAGASPACPSQGERFGVELATPKGFTIGATLPTGFKKVTLTDPFTATRAGTWGDGLHSTKLTGYITPKVGSTVTVSVPVTLASSGAGSAEVVLGGSALEGDDLVGLFAHSSWTWSPTGGSASIASSPSKEIQDKPEDWNANSPTSFDIPVRTVATVGKFKGVAWKPTTAPRSKDGLCPGGQRVQDNGVCPGLPVEGNANQQLNRRSARRAHAASTTCMTGQLVYSDPSGVHPAVNVPIEAWDVNTAVDDKIADGFTDWSGNFNICFDNSERGWFQSGTADVKLVFVSANNRYRVVNDCCLGSGLTPGNYNLVTGTTNNIASGTVDVGAITPSDSNFQRVFHAYDLLTAAWAWSNARSPGAGTCWTNGECDQKTIQWWPSSDVWPHYGGWCSSHTTPAWVCLPGPGPDSGHVVLHEIGHNVMDDTFGGMPPHSCPDPHYLTTNEDAGCAWTEGWPTWYAAAIMNRPVVAGYPTTSPYESDNDSWQNYSSRARGSNVEARVVGALWDLQDSSNEGVWDRSSLGDQVLWDAFRKRKPQSWSGMITALSQEGVDTTTSSFRSTLYGNTIDMATSPFRDPLGTSWASRTLPPVSAPSLSPTVNTSNDHGFVWNRASSICTDRVEVENVGSWSGGYRQAGSGTFSYSNFRLSAYSSSNLSSGQLATAGGFASLASAGALSIALPVLPLTVYVKTNGATRTMPIPDGGNDTLPTSHYRIRGVKCSAFSLASPWLIDRVLTQSASIQLEGGRTYAITFKPTGTSSTGKSQKASLAIGDLGWSAPCVQDGQANAQCEGGALKGKPLATKSSTTAGTSVALGFTPQKSGLYEVRYSSLVGSGSGKVTAATRAQ